jgi:SAM-dependent methyltransferase
MPSPDTAQLRALTESGAATWSSGDFNEIARTLMPAAEDLVREADPAPGARLLDIACGSGNVALIAARRFCEVTGIDIAPNLIARARVRAKAEGSTIDFQTGDAQALAFPDGSFDVVTSAFGIMFAPDQPTAAAEALRVCRPGGRIALANWMPEGFGRDFFSAHARYAPPPEGAPSPLVWGTEDGIAALLGDGSSSVDCHRRSTTIYYRSVDHLLQTNACYFGPTIRALERLGDADAAALDGRPRHGGAALQPRR